MGTLNLLAFDIGASNGRGILGRFDGERIEMTPLHQFENHFTQQGDLYTWDVFRIHQNMKQAFIRAKAEGTVPDSFGIDTWGVDYGLLDSQGGLVEAPRAYRMSTDHEMRAAWERIPERRMFDLTGISAISFNTVFQLYRRVREGDWALSQAGALLMMPDLLAYFLTGVKSMEYTAASSTGLVDLATRTISREILEALDIPGRLFCDIVMPGRLLGELKDDIAREVGLPRVPYALVGTHDTASAVAAIPGTGDFAFCSSGTWSCFGFESDTPQLSDEAFLSRFGNEGSVQGAYRPLLNLMGLWLVQECRREWAKDLGYVPDWEDIKQQAEQALPLRSVINPDDAIFYKAGDMPKKIQDYCRQTHQPVPETIGQIARACYESLALKYRYTIERMGKMRGKPVSSLNITGGGIQNNLLNQMAADSTGLPVTAGPIEGAAMGNALMQAMALGEITGMEELRQVVRASVQPRVYLPRRTQAWEDAYGKLLDLLSTTNEK